MGYYSDLDVRVQELGHKPGTRAYFAAARQLHIADCRQHRGFDRCDQCKGRGQCDMASEGNDAISITITCRLCGYVFTAEVPPEDMDGYMLLEDGTYDGSEVDHCCDRCAYDDEWRVTRDWQYR